VVPAVTTQPPADTQDKQIPSKPATAQKSQARDAKPSPPKRTARRKIVRQRKESPIVITPAQPVQTRPAPVPKRNNLWDAPTDSGFNQK